MNIRVKIYRKQVVRLFVFVVFMGFTFMLDSYLGNREAIEIVGENTPESQEPGIVCFFQSTVTFGAKIMTPTIYMRKFVRQMHNKLIQKYHQLKNYRLLKCEVRCYNKPVVLTSHFLGLRNCFPSSDDIPYNNFPTIS